MQQIYAYSLRILTGKNYFVNEMQRALLKKFPDEDISAVIAQLLKDKYLDDDKLFYNYVRWKAESGYGPYYIRQKLQLRGISRSVQEIGEVMDAEEIDTSEAIRAAVQKYKRTRCGSGRKKDAAAFMRSCLAYLTGRGFATSECIKILKEEGRNESDFFEGC